MRRPDPSPGRQRPIQSWKKSSDYVNVFPGHNTRRCKDVEIKSETVPKVFVTV
jgi:hypothetical protein